MALAIEEAKIGLTEGGIPIGSVLVKEGRVIGRGHNRRVQDGDPIMHAEIACLHNAGRQRSYGDTILYSTLMPCYLCAGAAVQFGIKHVVVGESKTFAGAREFLEKHQIKVDDMNLPVCQNLMADFIKNNPMLWNEDIGKE